MKIVCESCGAKYSIADEKVAGKVFKIRCKRCSEVIVVRGDEESAADQPDETRVYDYGADAIWHVVVEGEQAGPYTPAQLGEMLTAGTVDWDAYVWCEGFDNWVPMRDVDDLVAQITGGDAGAGAQPAAAAAAVAAAAPNGGGMQQAAAMGGGNLFGNGQPSMGADPFADDGASGNMFGAAADSGAGPDLFGGGAAEVSSPFDGGVADAGVVASAPSPRVSTEQAMTGARNENSVLFSLKNLQALATGSSTPSAPPTGGGAGAGFAAGEGSGLIDIRALASATGVGDGEDRDGEKDELLSMGSQAGAFGTLGSPMLAPAVEESDGGGKGKMVAIMVGFGMLCLAAVAVAWILKPAPPPPPAAVVAPTAPVAAAATAVGETEKPAQEAEDEDEPTEGELAAKKAAEAEKDDDSDESKKHRRRTSSSSSKSSSDSNDERSAAPAPKPEPAPAKSSGPRTLDDLLDNALQGKGRKSGGSTPARSSSDENLQEKPTRDQVVKAMNGVKSAVSACAKGASGVAFANITVKGSTGRVTAANIEGQTGAVGSCIARAVRKAKFPKFKADTFKVKFPFRL